MAETTTQASKPQILKYPLAPLKLFQQTFCRRCDIKCGLDNQQMRNCILAAILDLQAQQTKTKQERIW